MNEDTNFNTSSSQLNQSNEITKSKILLDSQRFLDQSIFLEKYQSIESPEVQFNELKNQLNTDDLRTWDIIC